MEHEEHDNCKDRDAKPLVGQHSVDLVAEVVVACAGLALFDLLYDVVDKFETLAVGGHDGFLARQVNVTLYVRRLLRLGCLGDSHVDHSLEAFAGGGDGIYNRTAELCGQRGGINLVALFVVYVALVQRHDHRHTELEQLSGEEQTAAQVGGVHNVYDDVGIFLLHIGAGDAFLAGEGGH